MTPTFTFVTALYEIDREIHDKRSFKQYQEWFSRTLTIPVPMVIYTEGKNKNMIEIIRKNLPTKVFYTKLEDVPFYYTVDSVRHIIKNTVFKHKIRHPRALENNCFEYIPIIHSKFKWMSNAIQQNYFQTELFFWIDAGLSRFMNFDISIPQFNTELINHIYTNNKIYMQIGKNAELQDILSNPEKIDDYIGQTVNFIMAGFWGGTKDILYDICNKCADNYINEFIQKERIDNEQTLFAFVLPKYKEQIIFIDNVRYECVNYYIFCNQL
jgi:hypothetical protein